MCGFEFRVGACGIRGYVIDLGCVWEWCGWAGTLVLRPGGSVSEVLTRVNRAKIFINRHGENQVTPNV